ncbi:hypothetical protein PGIGA_G00117790 [Pangasianodon gigas]|uniref:Uncharacterized protein n=1 Tax=Pangasianodon gigas TaxID=30993 RepID=A0ACC5XFB8_PANGG|nr:hypothetical protein [Pangasianodon gigas]
MLLYPSIAILFLLVASVPASRAQITALCPLRTHSARTLPSGRTDFPETQDARIKAGGSEYLRTLSTSSTRQPLCPK